ncbi:hypothetical protein LTR36_004290 [Oleoguttula mirabilis]|uniref:DUF7907 domain-containing protein n=1 Tax=Oleoguttula mirabilis TaxID=1507867 RepID=A0AAV9JHN8_9PEZI|nr:hypothetical protein LTR36_004290 [Oleoguttula mirabilis]
MQLLATILVSIALLTSASAQFTGLNTSREYNIRTCLKPGQPGKARFDNLWLDDYHTGAGLSDAVFFPTRTNVTAAGYLYPTNQTSAAGQKYYYQAFNLGNPFPWQLVMAFNTNFYAAWQPVRVNAGLGGGDTTGESSGFFLNSTGLQYGGAEGGFDGWLVCNWWHEMPQLFFRITGYGDFTPLSCADVYLMPEYI